MGNEFDFSTIPAKIRYVGETMREDWQCDQWEVIFTYKGGTFRTDYYTGLGHRKKAGSGFLAQVKPRMPDIKAIMHSVLLDSEAIDTSFVDWCNELGFSSDSIKALDTYRACCEVGSQLRKMFSAKDLEAMREALQDY